MKVMKNDQSREQQISDTLEQREAELTVINSVQEGLVREMDMETIFSLVADRICDLLNTQTMILRTFSHENGRENWDYAIENGERLYHQLPFIWANSHLIETRESLLINEDNIKTDQQYNDTEQGVSKGLPLKSAISVTMVGGENVIGSVSLQNMEREKARLFNETARLVQETEQRATELQTVNNINRVLVSQLEVDRCCLLT